MKSAFGWVPAPVVMFGMSLLGITVLLLAVPVVLLVAAAGAVAAFSFGATLFSLVGAAFGAAGALNAAAMSMVTCAAALTLTASVFHYGRAVWRFVFGSAPEAPRQPLRLSLAQRDQPFAA